MDLGKYAKTVMGIKTVEEFRALKEKLNTEADNITKIIKEKYPDYIDTGMYYPIELLEKEIVNTDYEPYIFNMLKERGFEFMADVKDGTLWRF